MEEILLEMMDKKIDVVCTGGASIRGTVIKVGRGVLQLKDDEDICIVAIDKIAVVWETSDDTHKAGFVNVKPPSVRSK